MRIACCPVPAAVSGKFGCGLFASLSFRSEHGTDHGASAARQADQRCPVVPQQCPQRKAVDCAGPEPPIYLLRSGRAAFGLRSDEIRPSKPRILHIFEHRRIWSAGTRLRRGPGCPLVVAQCLGPSRSDTASQDGPPRAAIRGCNPATPPVNARSKTTDAERCRSGRTGRSRKPLTLCGVPGFESLSLRQ